MNGMTSSMTRGNVSIYPVHLLDNAAVSLHAVIVPQVRVPHFLVSTKIWVHFVLDKV